MIDMATLIMENRPDPNGNTIPRNIQEGSATFASAKDLHSPMTLVVDGGIYNVTTATCGCSYVTCCGINQDELVPHPMYCPIGQTMQCSAQGVDCNGNTVGLGPGSWSSSNTSVMTVDSSGNVTGHAVGQATINYTGPYLVDATGTFCLPEPTCPSAYPVLQDTATVQVPTYFFSPSATQTSEPPACQFETGYFINVSYYVAAQDSSRVSQSGMAPGENVGSGWNDAFATPKTTRSDGSFNDTPVGACYGTSGHFCAAGLPQSFRLTNNGQVFSIMTNTTSRTCTDGIKLVIQGNPTAQNKTYTFGNTQ
jgi:hypothetical protein